MVGASWGTIVTIVGDVAEITVNKTGMGGGAANSAPEALRATLAAGAGAGGGGGAGVGPINLFKPGNPYGRACGGLESGKRERTAADLAGHGKPATRYRAQSNSSCAPALTIQPNKVRQIGNSSRCAVMP